MGQYGYHLVIVAFFFTNKRGYRSSGERMKKQEDGILRSFCRPVALNKEREKTEALRCC